MSTDNPSAATAQTRRRTAMPADPSEDELARNWSLTPTDLAAIAACRGADQRRRFALQLCMLRTHGRFLDDYRHAPIKIVNHLSKRMNFDIGQTGGLLVAHRAHWPDIPRGVRREHASAPRPSA
jgi:hypothetical protein